jgi:hypothetical protein
MQNGYISSNIQKINKMHYIHQIITDCYGNGKGTNNISVDHIDRDPLNNTLENVRIATREQQEANKKGSLPNTRRERQSNARTLPDGITQDMMPKYVTYNENIYDKENEKMRNYFRIEWHPNYAPKVWESSKSMKISIQDKLKETLRVLENLNNGIIPVLPSEEREKQIPKYVSISKSREKMHLMYEKRHNGERYNLRMVLPETYDLQEQIKLLNEKVINKYGKEHRVLAE